VDEVRRLLERFANEASAEAPPVDVDADIARGRRALRRIRTRRRTAGVLCIAAAIALIAVAGNPARWFAGGDPGVATDEPAPARTLSPTPDPTLDPTPDSTADSTADSTPVPSVFVGSATPVVLVPNTTAWPGDLQCKLVPAGWRQTSVRSGAVELSPPDIAVAGASQRLVLRAAVAADRIDAVEAVRTGGRIAHLGRYPDGSRAGQVKFTDRWLIVRLPVGEPGWTDTTLQRLLESCVVR
jgi:hypothetical protein